MKVTDVKINIILKGTNCSGFASKNAKGVAKSVMYIGWLDKMTDIYECRAVSFNKLETLRRKTVKRQIPISSPNFV